MDETLVAQWQHFFNEKTIRKAAEVFINAAEWKHGHSQGIPHVLISSILY